MVLYLRFIGFINLFILNMDFQNILNNAFAGSNENIEMFNSINDNLSIILAGNHLNEVNLSSSYDSGFCSYINQSTILAGSVPTIENNNNKCTNTRRKENETIILDENKSFDEDNEIDILNTNIDAISDQTEIFYDSLECKTDSFATTEAISNNYQAKKLTPLVDVTSSEQSNGTFRVQIHIKGFEEENKSMAKLKLKEATRDAYDNLNKKIKLANFNQSSKAIGSSNTIVGKPYFKDFDNKENYDPNIIAQFSKRSCTNHIKSKHNCL